MVGFHCVIDEVLVLETFLEILIYTCKVDVQYFGNIIQLIADAAG